MWRTVKPKKTTDSGKKEGRDRGRLTVLMSYNRPVLLATTPSKLSCRLVEEIYHGNKRISGKHSECGTGSNAAESTRERRLSPTPCNAATEPRSSEPVAGD